MATFFIAEDDKFMFRLYERVFTNAGHTLEVAEDGEAALGKLAAMNEKPKVIVLDVMMPKVNGFEVLEKIKKDPSLKDIPVMMLTNLSGEEDKKKAIALGAKEYFIKSDHDPKQVLERVLVLAGVPQQA